MAQPASENSDQAPFRWSTGRRKIHVVDQWIGALSCYPLPDANIQLGGGHCLCAVARRILRERRRTKRGRAVHEATAGIRSDDGQQRQERSQRHDVSAPVRSDPRRSRFLFRILRHFRNRPRALSHRVPGLRRRGRMGSSHQCRRHQHRVLEGGERSQSAGEILDAGEAASGIFL